MRNITPKQKELFVNGLTKELIKLGAKPLKENEFTLDTIGGTLWTRIDGYCMFTLFTRFEDVERAKNANIIGMNQHSGKWNHHMTTTQSKVAIETIIDEIKTILPKSLVD